MNIPKVGKLIHVVNDSNRDNAKIYIVIKFEKDIIYDEVFSFYGATMCFDTMDRFKIDLDHKIYGYGYKQL